jgi:hypothetical protein
MGANRPCAEISRDGNDDATVTDAFELLDLLLKKPLRTSRTADTPPPMLSNSSSD